MKKAKKIVSFLLAIAMVAGLMSACNNEPAPVSSDPASAGNEVSQDVSSEETNEKDYSEKMSYTMSAIDAENFGLNGDGTESAVWTWLKEKYNVDFEFWPLTWGNYIDQTRMWLSTDDSPDIMMHDVAAVRYGEFLEWVDAGLFKPYDLDNAPNMAARLEGMPTGQKFIVDGELYAWPAYQDTADYDYVAATTYLYRTDWAEAVGLYNENDIYTWDEWWALMDAINEQKPGGAETIPLIVNGTWMFPSYITLGMAPYMQKFTQDENGTWVWGATLPETTEALKFAKEKYDAGIIWRDQVVFPENCVSDNRNANRLFASLVSNISAGSIAGDKTSWEDANPDLVAEGAKYEDIFSIAMVRDPNGKFSAYQVSDHWSQEAMSHKLSDEKAARWTDMLDYLVSDEGYFVRNYGIPEVDWKWEGDEAVCLWTETDDNGNLVNPNGGVWQWARIAGCNDNFSNYSPSTPAVLKERVINAMEIFSGDEANMIPVNADVLYFADQAYLDATAGLEEATYGKIAELIGSDDFIAQWEAWTAEKLVEVQPAIDALNNAGF